MDRYESDGHFSQFSKHASLSFDFVLFFDRHFQILKFKTNLKDFFWGGGGPTAQVGPGIFILEVPK